MSMTPRSIARAALKAAGLELKRIDELKRITPPKIDLRSFPTELSEGDRAVFDYVRQNDLSMATDDRLYATLLACRYAAEANIPGDFVECGVWRGGNAILAADVFKRLAPTKKVYLFDTFAGMTAPTAHDGSGAVLEYKQNQRADYNEWCLCPLEEVKSNFAKYRLDAQFIVGDVMKTLSAAPETISVLRLDTDWYESTKYELETLYPRLCSGGVLMIDDYGHWRGARKAVDEYFHGRRPFFNYIDYTGRAAVKP
jgi:O-methyltransferase